MPEAKPRKKRTVFQKIVNAVLAVFATILVLLIILIGFTQTGTFRKILKEKLITTVNSSLNGKIKVDEIKGTLFSSIHLINPVVTVENDTVITADKISAYINPLQLIFNKIYIRKFDLIEGELNFVKDEKGILNISKLAKQKEEIDTTEKSPFPFAIVVDDLNLVNTSLKYVDYDKINTREKYAFFTLNDFKADSLFLRLGAYLNIKENEYKLALKDLKFIPNLQNFRLQELKGIFEVDNNQLLVKDLILKSKTSDIILNAKIDDVNFFENFTITKLKNSPVNLQLNAKVFDFSDLSSFASSTDIMKGTLRGDIKASGTYGNINISKFDINYLQTNLNLKGNIKNLHDPENMFFDVNLKNSNLVEENIAELLPTIPIPIYKGLELKNIDLKYKGKPLDFYVKLNSDIDKGKIILDGKMDLTSDKTKYDLNLDTDNLNLQSVINAPTNLNIKAKAKGLGFAPEEMNATLNAKLRNSTYDKYFIDSLKLFTKAVNGLININTSGGTKNSNLKINGDLDLRDAENPAYNLTGNIRKLDLEKLLSDSALASNINMDFNINGKSFDLQKMDSQFDINIFNTTINGVMVDSTNLNLAYTFLTDNERLIDINSDFARMQIAGNYSLDVLIPLLAYQSEIITQSIMKKIYEFDPLVLVKDEAEAKDFETKFEISKTVPMLVKEEVDIGYNIVITDFKLISLFTGMNQINMDGNISGNIKNSNNLFEISNKIDLNSLKLISPTNVSYISNLNLELKLQRENDPVDFENISAEAKLTADRIFSGTDAKNIFAYIELKKNIFGMHASSDIDTSLNLLIAGNVDLTNNQYAISVDTFSVNYLDYHLTNQNEWLASYDKERFQIDQLKIKQTSGPANIDINGVIYSDGREDIKLFLNDVDAELANKLAGLENDLKAELNLKMFLSGYLHDPEIKLNLNINDIIVDNTKFGYLDAKFDYKNKQLTADIIFLDSTYNTQSPELELNAFVPIDLAFIGVEERQIEGENISIKLKSDEFFLNTFGGLIPSVNNLSGLMIADVNISGTYDNLDYSGSLELKDVKFIAEQNNLMYKLNLSTGFKDETILINEMTLSNEGGTNYNGVLKGSGKIELDGFELKKMTTAIIGDLAVLSNTTKPSIPFVTSGNLVIQTGDTWRYNYENGNSFFNGEALLRNTQITIVPQQTAYSSLSDYNYVYVVDSSKIDKSVREFNSVLNISKKYSAINQPGRKNNSAFNFSIKAEIENEAEVTFIINRVANQRLVAILDGAILYESDGVAQGQFNLKEGSFLQLIKKFDAEGSIYFERDPTDPRLDITATYAANHVYGSDSGMVAVKIKLNGPVSELGQNLAKNEENIAVYKGEANIENNIPSPEYTTADAFSFIVFGKFTNELTASDKTGAAFDLSNELSGYTTSALSGVLSSYINSQIGDAIKSIEFQNSQRGTRLSLIGQLGKVRYTFGYLYGDQSQTSNFGGATGKVEYYVTKHLIFRLERKDPIILSTDINEKINELGIRYKFSF